MLAIFQLMDYLNRINAQAGRLLELRLFLSRWFGLLRLRYFIGANEAHLFAYHASLFFSRLAIKTGLYSLIAGALYFVTGFWLFATVGGYGLLCSGLCGYIYLQCMFMEWMYWLMGAPPPNLEPVDAEPYPPLPRSYRVMINRVAALSANWWGGVRTYLEMFSLRTLYYNTIHPLLERAFMRLPVVGLVNIFTEPWMLAMFVPLVSCTFETIGLFANWHDDHYWNTVFGIRKKGWQGFVIFAVLVEELVKYFLFCLISSFPYSKFWAYSGFGLVELIFKWWINDDLKWPVVFPFLLHVATACVPFYGAFVMHSFWNLFFFHYNLSYVAMFGNRHLHFPNERERDLIRRKIRSGAEVHFSSKNYHPRKNRDLLVDLLNGKQAVKLKGVTTLDDRTFNFPFHGSVRDFLRMLDLIADHKDRRDLCLYGILSRDMYLKHSECFMQPAQREDFTDEVNMMGLSEDATSMLSSIEEVSFVADVIYKIAKKDWLGLAFSGGMKARAMANLLFMTKLDSVKQLGELAFIDDDPPQRSIKEDEDIQMMGLSEVVLDFIPKQYSSSPNLRRLLALICLVSMSPFVRDLAVVQSISQFVTWDTLPTGQSFMETSLNGASALYSVIGNAVSGKGSLVDILGMPKNVSFITQARDLTTRDFSDATVQEVEKALMQINELQESRKFLYNDPEIVRLKDRLEVTTRTLVNMLHNAEGRSEPMFIGLLGVPGTGKTTLMLVLVDMLRKLMKLEEKPNDVINYNITDKFPIESCKYPASGVFLLLNDVPGNYSGYRNLDMLPLDIVLQRVIDDSPLDFRSAAVEDKGVLVNHLTHMILSSNERNFAGAEDSKKLLRRVNNGVTVWMHFVHNGKTVDYDDLPKKLSPSERNDCIRFTIQKAHAKGVAFGFKDTSLTVGLTDFLRIVAEKHRAHQQKIVDTAAKFRAEGAKCSCGVPYVMHWTKGEFKPIFDNCKLDGKFCVDWVFFEPQPAPSRWELFKRWLFPAKITMTSLGYVTASLWSLVTTYACWLLYSSDHRAQVQGLYDVFRLGRLASWLDIVMSFPLLRSSYLLHAVIFKPQDFEKRKAVIYVAETVIVLRRFVLDNRKALLGTAAALSIYWLMGRTSQNVEMQGKPIFRDQVDPKSMFVYEVEREQRWTPEQQRVWGKTEDFVDVLKLVKLSVGPDYALKLAHTAVRPVEVRTPDKKCEKGSAVLWNAEWVSLNKHFLKNAVDGGKFSVKISGIEVLYDLSEALPIPSCEHVLIKNYFDKTVGPLADLLPESIGEGPWWVYLTLSKDYTGAVKRGFTNPDTNVSYPGIHVARSCVSGDCGNLLLISSPKGYCVGGMLSAGVPGTPNSFYSVITRDSFSAATSRVPFPEVHDYIKELPQMMSSSLSHNSDLRHFSYPLLKPLGTLLEPTRSFRTKFVRTVLYDEFAGKLSQPYCPPRKINGLKDGVYKSSLLHTFKYVDLPFKATDSQLLQAGMDWLNTALPPQWVKSKNLSLRPCDVGESIFGDPNIGLDRVNFNSSCGREWREWGITNKFDLFTEIEPDKFVMKPEFRDAMAELLVHYRNGDIPVLRVDFAPKDELRTQEKIDDFAIRDFSVVGVHRNLLQRGFLMPIILVLLAYPFQSECFGQMNAASFEWSALADYLKKFPNHIDIDFSKMDTSHKSQMIELVARLFFLAALRLGYEQWEASVCYMSVKSLSLQVMIYNNDVAYKMFGLPSGVIITLIMNSIVNSILMRMAFFELCPGLNFREHVSPATTGDDNFSGISNEVIGRYNMLTLVDLYRSWGYVITPAKKNAELRRQIPFDEGTFLKRRFVWSDELKAYVAPIDTDSIYKALCFQSKEGNVHPNARLQQVALGCQREAFMHGRDFFEQMRKDLRAAFDKHQIGVFFSPLEYEDLKVEFVEKRFRTWMI